MYGCHKMQSLANMPEFDKKKKKSSVQRKERTQRENPYHTCGWCKCQLEGRRENWKGAKVGKNCEHVSKDVEDPDWWMKLCPKTAKTVWDLFSAL